MATVVDVLPDLAQFTGTTSYLRHRIMPTLPGVLLTEGARYVAEQAGAWWLMDLVSINCRQWLLEGDDFCALKLTVTGSSAVLEVSDGDGNTLHEETIGFTDFPEPGIEFFLQQGEEPVLMLRSEY